MLSTQSGIANCTYISLQPEKSCLHMAGMNRKQGDWKQMIIRLVGCEGVCSVWGTCVLFVRLFVWFQEDAVPSFGGPLSRLSVPGRHINSTKNCDSWLYLTAGSLLGAWLCWGNTLTQPDRGCLHNCSQIERCCRNANTGWIFIRKCDHHHGHLPSFFFFFFSFRNNSSTGWESVYLDCCGGNCWLG